MPTRIERNSKMEAFLKAKKTNPFFPFSSEFEHDLCIFIVESQLSRENAKRLLYLSKRPDLQIRSFEEIISKMKEVPKQVLLTFLNKRAEL